jgi:hypothetical protein
VSFRAVSTLSAACVLSACTSYQPKADELAARLRLVTYTVDQTNYSVNDMKACPERRRLIYTQIGGFNFTSSKQLGMVGTSEVEAKNSTELLIPAGFRLPMVVGSSQTAVQYVPGYSCSVGLAFEPRANAQYEVQYRHENRGCNVRLFELVQVEPSRVDRVQVSGASSFRGEPAMNTCSYR